MRQARISVLLPCHNAQSFLDEALQSLAAQTFRDFTVIAVDDGSTDQTANILDSWRTRLSLVAVRTPHRGLVHSLIEAARRSDSEFIARLDADDRAHATRFERQIEFLRSSASVAACGTGVAYFPETSVRDGARAYAAWLNGLHEPHELARDVFVECPIAHPTLMVRTAAFHAAGGYADRGWPEDYDLILRLWAAGYGLANVPRVLHDWRERELRLSRTDPCYTLAAFRRCKVHYLKRTLLLGRAVSVWGAGPVGKAFARELLDQDVPLRAFIDIDPRKIGQTIYDVPVLSPADVSADSGAFVVAAVGSATARAEIRAALSAAGLTELRDYCAVA